MSMWLWLLLGSLASVLSCQPPIPQSAFSQDVSYNQQATPQAEYSQSSVSQSPGWEPFPGYQQPPPAGNDIVPFNRALSAPIAPVGQTQPPLENIPPPVDLEALKMAGRCAEIKSITEFEDCVQVSLLPRQSPDAWRCGFEDGNACRFQPITSGFSVGRLPAPGSYASLARMTARYDFDSPQGQFLYIISPQGLKPNEELIVSTKIPCQRGDGELRMSYWLYPPEGTIRVCTLDEEMRSCTQPFVHTNQSGVIVAVINPTKANAQTTSFEVEIVAQNLVQPSIFIIDNIEYKGDFCEPKVVPINDRSEVEFFEPEDTIETPTSNVRRTPARIPNRPNFKEIEAESQILKLGENIDDSLNADIESMPEEDFDPEQGSSPARESGQILRPQLHRQTQAANFAMKLPASKNPCNVLRCHFEENFCGWHNLGDGEKYGEWRYRGYKKTAVSMDSREAVELEDDAGIAYAGSDAPPSTLYRQIHFILESPEFLALTNMTMLYDVKRQTNDITLQVCFDTLMYCPYKLAPYREEQGWQIDEAVTIPEGTRRVFMKAIQWKKYARILIDNIRIVGC